MRLCLLLFLLALWACESGYDAEVEAVLEDRKVAYRTAAEYSEDLEDIIRRLAQTEAYQRSAQMRDSLLALGPSIRWHSDSLAHQDSIAYTYFLATKISDLYYYGDATEAVFAYLESLGWFKSYPIWSQVDEARRFAETTGSAVDETLSPNMARLTYQAFERAKQLALAHGDPQYIHLADSSYKAVARRVLAMPDSVRAAFGTPPDRPARIPWVLATLAAAFIATSVASRRGWKR